MSDEASVITVADKGGTADSADPVTVITLDDTDSLSTSHPKPLITLDDCEPDIVMTPVENKGKHAISDEAWSGKRACNQMHTGLSEEDVGINQYVSSLAGFNAVIKQRYSDFHVNEIDMDGNVAKLTSMEVPKEEEEIKDECADKTEILSILSEEQYKSIEEVIASNDKSKNVLINVTSLSKVERKKIHQLLKSVFKSTVYSNTIDKENEKFIQVGVSAKIDDRRNRQHFVNGEYLHFILHKENMDHSQVISLLCHLLKMKPNLISAAGTKDKRAKTTQWISIRRVKADRIGRLRLKSTWCGHYCYKKEPLKLGDLKGNQFRIALRNVLGDDSLIKEAMESVKQRGFINYYGLQRFGSSVVAPTHVIGKTLLQGKWKEAVELILKPRPKEKADVEMSLARDTWWSSRNAKSALRCLRNPMKSIEGKLLLALDKLGPAAYVNALEKLPRCTALLYVHGYQSYVWNKIVSRRIDQFGLAPIAGDLVVADDVDLDVVCSRQELLTEAVIDPESEVTEESRSVIDKSAHSFVDKDSSNPSVDSDNVAKTNGKENGVDRSDKSKIRRVSVKKLSQEDLLNAKMEDIIYPLPGYDVEYPDNIISKWYEEILAEDDLTTSNFKQSVKLFSVPGSYRKMLCIPRDLSWEMIKYKNENDCLILSDIEKLKGLPQPTSEEDGRLKGISLKMCLPSCSYATMCLREITKSSTSVSHQASLTAKSMEAISSDRSSV